MFCVFAGCSSRPGWITQLPAGDNFTSGTRQMSEKLRGFYERPFASYYSASGIGSRSAGLEWLCIDTGHYWKFHLLAEQHELQHSSRLYLEQGQIQIAVQESTIFVLLIPEMAQSQHATIPIDKNFTKKLGKKHQNQCALKRVSQATVFLETKSTGQQSVAAPASSGHGGSMLYYYFEEPKTALLPAAFERQGTVYDYGTYEGAQYAYDSTSSGMRRALQKFRTHEHQTHAYYKVSRHSDR